MGFLLLLAVAITALAIGRSIISTHDELVPLKNEVLEKKENLESCQSSASVLVARLQACINSYQNYEKPILNRYFALMEAGKREGLSGTKAVTVFQSFSPPTTQAAHMYQSLMQQLARLEDDFQKAVREYNASVTALNNRKEVFPTNLLGDTFFSIPRGIYLRAEDKQLLPAKTVKLLLDDDES